MYHSDGRGIILKFRIAKESDTKEVKRLWSYCFEPEDHPFFKYYFGTAYEPDNTMVGIDRSYLVSTVHLRQNTIRVRGVDLPMSYMVGVATDPIVRRSGVGKKLLKAALGELKERGQGLTILMPSSAGFYQNYGWDLYAHQWVQTMKLDELAPLLKKLDKTLSFGMLRSPREWKRLAGVYETYTKPLSGYAVRKEKEWVRLLESIFAEGVQVGYVKNDSGQLEGYCFYRLGEPEIGVSEFVYTTRRAQKALLNFLYNHRSQGESVRWNEGMIDQGYIFHTDGKTGHSTMPFMMSRIVDVKLAMESIPVPVALEGAIQFGVKDPLCEWNHGTYVVSYKEGKAQVVKHKEHVDINAKLVFSVGALSLLLMGRMSATELAFEETLEGPDDILEVLNRAYPRQNTYINEWW